MAELSGGGGKFSIEKDGVNPESGEAYHYKNSFLDFWFYAKVKQVPEFLLEIASSSTERFSGGPPRLSQQQKSAVEKDIQKYFEQFDVFGRPQSMNEPIWPVRFTWRFQW